jgi:hypothetical protein
MCVCVCARACERRCVHRLRFAQFSLFFGRTLNVALGHALNSDASCTYMYIFALASGVNTPPECEFVCVCV